MENENETAYWSWIDFLGTDVDDHIFHTLLLQESIGNIKVGKPWRWWMEHSAFTHLSPTPRSDLVKHRKIGE